MTVRLILAMNDENGYSMGRVRQIEAYVNNEHAYTLEPTCNVNSVCTCEIWTGANQLKLGKFVFPLISYHTRIGNNFWNEVEITDETHAKIFESLKNMAYKPIKRINTNPYPKWQMTEGLNEWIKRWDIGLIGVWIDQDT